MGREKGWLKPTLVRSVNGKNPGFALQNYHLFFINYRPYFTSEHLILVNKYVSGAPMKGWFDWFKCRKSMHSSSQKDLGF